MAKKSSFALIGLVFCFLPTLVAGAGDIRLRFAVDNLCPQRSFAAERMLVMGESPALQTAGIQEDKEGQSGYLYAHARPDSTSAFEFLPFFIIPRENRIKIKDVLLEATGQFKQSNDGLFFTPEGQNTPRIRVRNPEAASAGDTFVRGTLYHHFSQRSPVSNPGGVSRAKKKRTEPETRYAFELDVKSSGKSENFTLPETKAIEQYRSSAPSYSFRTKTDTGIVYTLYSTVTPNGFAYRSPDGEINPVIKGEKGETITIRFINRTHGRHDFCIEDHQCTDRLRYSHGCDVPTKRTLSFQPDEAGKRLYYCSVRNHREQGMEGRLIVE